MGVAPRSSWRVCADGLGYGASFTLVQSRSAQLYGSRADFALAYPPGGQRTVLYFKAKLELFAEHTHDQGMVSRLTLYKDRARTIVKECREAFTHRRDRLASRVRYPLEGKVRERFLPGRQLSLKELVEWAGRRRERRGSALSRHLVDVLRRGAPAPGRDVSRAVCRRHDAVRRLARVERRIGRGVYRR